MLSLLKPLSPDFCLLSKEYRTAQDSEITAERDPWKSLCHAYLLRGVLVLLREQLVFQEHLQSTTSLCFVLSHTLSTLYFCELHSLSCVGQGLHQQALKLYFEPCRCDSNNAFSL